MICRRLLPFVLLLGAGVASADGLRGEPAAIADARAMVETMGGAAIWRHLESLHFVHEWDIANRHERYLEDEILDLTGPRSWVRMQSETVERLRAYSPEHGYWSRTNGSLEHGSEESLSNALERAPFSIYRLARKIARDDGGLEIRYGKLDEVPALPALEFIGPDGVPRGWIILNARKEPIVWATTQYVYVFGPLARFGNLWVPDWATTSEGLVRYTMVSLEGDDEVPDPALFEVPDSPG